jgi:hypothetical protein
MPNWAAPRIERKFNGILVLGYDDGHFCGGKTIKIYAKEAVCIISMRMRSLVTRHPAGWTDPPPGRKVRA